MMIKNKYILGSLTFLFAVLLCCFSVYADETNIWCAYENVPYITESNFTLADKALETVEGLTDTNLKMSEVKNLHDFAGNPYYAIELDPLGYIIVQAEANAVIEYSLDAPSPYFNLENGLYYAGPTYFYVYSDGVFQHTILDEVIDEADAASYATYCNTLYSEFGSPEEEEQSDVLLMSASTITYPHQSNFLQNLSTNSQIGNTNQNQCGYVAAGMLLLWADYRVNGNLINNFSYLNRSGTAFSGFDFTRKLRTYGGSNSSSADGAVGTSIKAVITGYITSVFSSCSVKTNLLPTKATILSKMQSYSPVIVFGNMYNVSNPSGNSVNHAFLAYGYTTDSNSGTSNLIVHYGWAGYSNITILPEYSCVYGSSLWIESTSSNTISLYDVSDTNWAYTAASYNVRYNHLYADAHYFRPNAAMDRGTFLQALYRQHGSPDISSYSAAQMYARFTDFSSTSNYHDAAIWAYNNGITSGTSSTTLGLEGNIDRQQAAVMMYKYAVASGYSFPSATGPSYTSFTDYSSVASWAVTGVNWATTHYLLSGTNGYINPATNLVNSNGSQFIYAIQIRAVKG